MALIHDEIREVLKRWVLEPGAAPGASAYVARFAGGAWRVARGAAGVHAGRDSAAVTPESIYDLASLTKPVVALTLARLARARKLAWEDHLGVLLPEASGTPSADTPVSLLASHRAGLEAHVRLRDSGVAREGWLALCASARRADCRTITPNEGFAPVYSDLGYILMGAVLERVCGQPVEQLVRQEVTQLHQLDLDSAGGWRQRLGSEGFLARATPTEVVPERGGLLWGVVHDDNCWDLCTEGVAGHAGLFGTASAMGGFGCRVLDALAGRCAGWLSAAEVEPLVRPRPGGSLRMGFDGKAEQGSSAGPRFGPRAFGHLGFTGTSLWCDPEAQVVVALLTNRVHPLRENIRIRDIRPSAHGELFGLAAGL